MNTPEAYIRQAWADHRRGEVTDDSTAEFLRNYMAESHQYIVRVYTALPRDA